MCNYKVTFHLKAAAQIFNWKTSISANEVNWNKMNPPRLKYSPVKEQKQNRSLPTLKRENDEQQRHISFYFERDKNWALDAARIVMMDGHGSCGSYAEESKESGSYLKSRWREGYVHSIGCSATTQLCQSKIDVCTLFWFHQKTGCMPGWLRRSHLRGEWKVAPD